jgi:hypothetical protein
MLCGGGKTPAAKPARRIGFRAERTP